jgi:hypothetical protein
MGVIDLVLVPLAIDQTHKAFVFWTIMLVYVSKHGNMFHQFLECG